MSIRYLPARIQLRVVWYQRNSKGQTRKINRWAQNRKKLCRLSTPPGETNSERDTN